MSTELREGAGVPAGPGVREGLATRDGLGADGRPRMPVTSEDVRLDEAVDVLRLLADRTRLDILVLLIDGECAVGAIARAVGRPVPGVSQHLAKLRGGHLVATRREGTTVYYALSSEHVQALVVNVIQHSEHVIYAVPPHHRSPSRSDQGG